MTEPRPDLVIAGELREHPASAAFAREVRRVHHRYAVEVVGAHRLCPFLRSLLTSIQTLQGLFRVRNWAHVHGIGRTVVGKMWVSRPALLMLLENEK